MMSLNTKTCYDRGMIGYHQDEQQDDMVQLARGLRRIKRRLLLEHAGVALPPSLVDSKVVMLVRSASDSTEVTYVNSPCSSPMTPRVANSVGSADSPGASSVPSVE